MILVTGANGLLGSFICKELKAKGLIFKALVRENSDVDMLRDLEEHILYGDFMDDEFLGDIMTDFEGVIHCAAVVSYHPKDRDLMTYINVEGTRRLVNVALANNIKRFLHVSSVAALGREESSTVVDENTQWTSAKQSMNYGFSKYLSEKEVWRGIQENLSAVIINPSLVLAPGNWKKSSAKIFKYAWDENVYYSVGKANYVDVRDFAKITLKLYSSNISGERYIVSAGSVDYKALFEGIARRFGKKPPHKPATKFELQVVVAFEKLKSLVTGKPALITHETAIVSQNQITYDNTKIKNKLKFNFVPLNDTLDWCCEEITRKYKTSN